MPRQPLCRGRAEVLQDSGTDGRTRQLTPSLQRLLGVVVAAAAAAMRGRAGTVSLPELVQHHARRRAESGLVRVPVVEETAHVGRDPRDRDVGPDRGDARAIETRGKVTR